VVLWLVSMFSKPRSCNHLQVVPFHWARALQDNTIEPNEEWLRRHLLPTLNIAEACCGYAAMIR